MQVNFTSLLTDNSTVRTSFRVPVRLAGDTVIVPNRSIVHTWRNGASVALRPFSTFSARVAYASTRDLQDYGDSTTVGRLLASQRSTFLGSEVGFERRRSLSTGINLNPVVSSWLRPRISATTNFTFNRDPNNKQAVRTDSDSTGEFRVPELPGRTSC